MFSTTTKRDAVLLGRVSVLEELVIPVCICIVYICVTSVSLVDQYPWSVRMLDFVVSSDPELLHVGSCIGGVVCTVLRIIEEVVEVY